MERHVFFGKDSANPSGAPEAGGATTRHSQFGGTSLIASLLRFMARVGRDLEATAYRRLKEMEQRRTGGRPSDDPGAPRRARGAGNTPDDAQLHPT
jgi:hypothetical protein